MFDPIFEKHFLVNGRLRKAFTLTELVVVLAIIIILAALLIPTIKGVIMTAHTTKCVSHHRSVVTGLLMYAGENDGRLPPYGAMSSPISVDQSRYWWNLIRPYLDMPKNPDLGLGVNYMRCPAAASTVSTTIGVHYAERPNNAPFSFEGENFPGSMKLLNLSGQTVLTADIENPAGQMWFLSPNEYPPNTDSDGDGIKDTYPGNSFAPRHKGGAVCGFADGSARLVPLAEWGRNKNYMWGPWSQIPPN